MLWRVHPLLHPDILAGALFITESLCSWGSLLITSSVLSHGIIGCYIFVCKSVSSVITLDWGHPKLHQNIIYTKQRLSSGGRWYCFLETRYKLPPYYICRKKNNWSAQLSFLENRINVCVHSMCNDFGSQLCIARKACGRKSADLDLMTADSSFYS